MLKCPDYSGCPAANNKPPATCRHVVKASSVRVEYCLLNSTFSFSAFSHPFRWSFKVYACFVTCLFLCLAFLAAPLLLQMDGSPFSSLLLTLNLSSLFHSPPSALFSGLDCFQEPHGVMPDLCPSVCVFHPCFPSSVSCPRSYASLQQPSSLSYQSNICFFAHHIVLASHILAFSPRYVTAFVSQLLLFQVQSPVFFFREYAFVGTVCNVKHTSFQRVFCFDSSFLKISSYL